MYYFFLSKGKPNNNITRPRLHEFCLSKCTLNTSSLLCRTITKSRKELGHFNCSSTLYLKHHITNKMDVKEELISTFFLWVCLPLRSLLFIFCYCLYRNRSVKSKSLILKEDSVTIKQQYERSF